MTTEQFVSTIFIEINNQLNLGATFESIHICKLDYKLIAVRGVKHSGKRHHIIHNFTKKQITHGMSREQMLRLVKKIDFVKNKHFFSRKGYIPKEDFNFEKWLESQRELTNEVNRDDEIVNRPWRLLV